MLPTPIIFTEVRIFVESGWAKAAADTSKRKTAVLFLIVEEL